MFSEIFIQGKDRTEELRWFAELVGLERIAPGRYSSYFLIQLFVQSFELGVLTPGRVIHEIEALEGIRKSTTKEPTAFKNLPLKGLWHKHHTVNGISSLARNMINGLKKDGLPWLDQAVKSAMESGEERYVTEEDFRLIVHDAVSGNYQRRSRSSELTGEWIVYAIHEGRNYYLSLGTHATGDENLRRQIDSACVPEFPFLQDILVPFED
ncbi:hypothetical protein [Pseudomonas panipatensis]|uniref:hypothetical protein n=1 Tax=Pseudomonas panipatensis TaxID=428992 RepID=UPI0035B1AC27